MNTLRTLIVDDEPIARRVLRNLLAAYPQCVLAGEAATFEEAEARLRPGQYDLVLLDIQLRGGNGFDLVPAIRPGARTIFVTAFDSYALRAFEVNALDYLLKPVTAERFSAALGRVLAPAPVAAADWSAGGSPLAADDTVLVRTDGGDRFVPVPNIAAVLSDGNYSEVFLRDGQRLFTRRSMKTWEELLPQPNFVRVHRRALVNFALIESQNGRMGEPLELNITGVREPIAVSRQSTPEVLGRLGALKG